LWKLDAWHRSAHDDGTITAVERNTTAPFNYSATTTAATGWLAHHYRDTVSTIFQRDK
jgi:hypothetical protein